MDSRVRNLLLRAYRKGDGEPGAVTRLALAPDPAAHGLDQVAHDVETKTHSRGAAGERAVDLTEAIEDVGEVAGGDTRAVVRHRHRHRLVVARHDHVDGIRSGGVLERVLTQVHDHLL